MIYYRFSHPWSDINGPKSEYEESVEFIYILLFFFGGGGINPFPDGGWASLNFLPPSYYLGTIKNNIIQAKELLEIEN